MKGDEREEHRHQLRPQRREGTFINTSQEVLFVKDRMIHGSEMCGHTVYLIIQPRFLIAKSHDVPVAGFS